MMQRCKVRIVKPNEFDDEIKDFVLDENIIDDGFGCTWSKTCPNCGRKSMEVVRPGKAQCTHCG